jgi:hypothetical protein
LLLAGITDKVKSTKKGESMKVMFGRSKHQINSLEREGRPCDGQVILSQIGKMTVLGVCGGRVIALKNSEGDHVGVALFVTTKRRIEVILNFLDVYDVVRIYTADDGTETVEAEYNEIYCDQLEQVVWQASVWE